jgi:hypothetical protein
VQAWFLPVTAKEKYTVDPRMNGVTAGRFVSWALFRNQERSRVYACDLFILGGVLRLLQKRVMGIP